MSGKWIRIILAALIGAAVLITGLAADAGQKAPTGALPGVDMSVRPPTLKRPPPDPKPDEDRSGWLHVGAWDVKISGSVTVDVGSGPRGYRPR